MTISTDPAAVAMQCLVDRINTSGGGYTLPSPATRARRVRDDMTAMKVLEVTVTPDEEPADEIEGTLDYDNFSAHRCRVWVRKKLADKSEDSISALNLIVAQVADFIDQQATDTDEVSVMSVDIDWANTPDRTPLEDQAFYSAVIRVALEVES